MFGADANWGRVLCAIGYTPGDSTSARRRCASRARPVRSLFARTPPITLQRGRGRVVLKEDEIDILVDLGSGDATAKAGAAI